VDFAEVGVCHCRLGKGMRWVREGCGGVEEWRGCG